MADSKEISLSVEESNALRAKLGLKPLRVDVDEPDHGGQAPGSSTIENDVLVSGTVPGQKKKADKFREKLETRREKKLLEAKLKSVKSLADDADEDDSAAAFVRKSRAMAKAKRDAEKKAKELESMDQEIESQTQQQINNEKYTAKDLAGLTVRHDKDTFQDGSTTILTLADSGVLDEGAEDELVNVNIEEDERHAENVQRKKGVKGFLEDYNALDDDEFETPGQAKAKKMLSKYDDIDAVSGDQKRKEKKKFALGTGGSADWKREEREAEIRQKLLKQSVTLDYEIKLDGADFYTKEEALQKFKKKKRRKVRKTKKSSKAMTADDLEALADEAPAKADRGKRGKRKRGDDEPTQELPQDAAAALEPSSQTSPDAETDGAGMDVSTEMATDDIDEFDQSHLLDQGPIEDEAEIDAQAEIAAAMARTKRIKAKKNKAKKEARIASLIKLSEQNDDGDGGGGGGGEADVVAADGLNFTDMTEFVRQVGVESDTEKKPKAKTKIPVASADTMDEQADGNESGTAAKEMQFSKGWTEAKKGDQVEAQVDVDNSDNEQGGVLGGEHNVSGGIMAALQFSKLRGFLDEDSAFGKRDRFKQMYQSDRFDNNEDERKDSAETATKSDRGRDRGRDRDGIVRQDVDKKNYNPTIKLEYRDDSGRLMKDKKEAFRYLSHKFHGKSSGRGKTEKRMIKQQEEMLSRKMLAGDTPLGMTSLIRKKMEETGNAHVVMSGAQQSVRKGKKKS